MVCIMVDSPFVLWSVELALDPISDVDRALNLRKAFVEHEFRNARCRRHFRLQNVGLAWMAMA
ncbi:MAG TPA: hypothetical protein VJ376_10930 [Pseudomonadota bacterium]|nr:hypothetical protein [Pseudomonadota bacterium]